MKWTPPTIDPTKVYSAPHRGNRVRLPKQPPSVQEDRRAAKLKKRKAAIDFEAWIAGTDNSDSPSGKASGKAAEQAEVIMKYTVSSVESKPSCHRTLKGAIQSCKRRLNVCDSEITIQYSDRRLLLAIPFDVDTTEGSILLKLYIRKRGLDA
jgi:hypothetical protein